MTSTSKDVFIVNSHDIVNKQNNAYHVTIKMKPVDVKSNTYISFSEENDHEDPNFKIGDVTTSKYKNIFAKVYVPNWSEEFFFITKVNKKTMSWTYVISDINVEEHVETFCEKELQKPCKICQI